MPAKSCAIRTRRRLPAVVASLALAAACTASQPTSPSPGPTARPSGTTPPAAGISAAPTPQTYRLSGVVVDESGAPVPGVTVQVDYPSLDPGAASTPVSRCPTPLGCWLQATTDADGAYRAEFTAGTWSKTPGPGYVYTFSGDSQVDVQPLTAGTTDIVQNLTIRPARRVQAGEMITVDVDAASSLCTDL